MKTKNLEVQTISKNYNQGMAYHLNFFKVLFVSLLFLFIGMLYVSAQSSDNTTKPSTTNWVSGKALLLRANTDQSDNKNENIYFGIGKGYDDDYWHSIKLEIQYEHGVGTRNGMFMDWGNLVLCSDWDNNSNMSKIIFGFNSNKLTNPEFDEKMRLTDKGRLGINMKSPLSVLHFKQLNQILKSGDNDTWGYGIILEDSDSHRAFSIGYGHNKKLRFGYSDNMNSGLGDLLALSSDGTLEVKNQIQIKGGNPAAGNFLTCDPDGLASWNEKILITEDGKVGIGTDGDPTSTLEVDGDIEIGRNGKLLSSWGLTLVSNYDSVGVNSEPMIFGFHSKTHPVERMRLTENGHLGIGTNNPSSTLEVDGDIEIGRNGKLLSSWGLTLVSNYDNYTGDNPEPMIFGFHSKTDPVERMRLTGEGLLGIGTSTPRHMLHLHDGSLFISDHGIDMKLAKDHDHNTDHGYIGTTNEKDFVVGTNNKPQISISHDGKIVMGLNGNVGIGNDNPTSKLNVTGDIEINGGGKLMTSWGLTLVSNYDNNTGTHPEPMIFGFHSKTDPVERMRLTENGLLGIGTDSPLGNLHIKNPNIATLLIEGKEVMIGIGNLTDNKGLQRGSITTSSDHPLGLGANGFDYIKILPTGQVIVCKDINHDWNNINSTLLDKYDLFVGTGILTADIALAKVASWADYVFEESYELKPLSELEKYITENKRIPNIPSKKEVNEKGYNMHEMNVKFLEKIEELTLYTIEQENKIKDLEQKMVSLVSLLEEFNVTKKK